jgi:HNH endonuclease.
MISPERQEYLKKYQLENKERLAKQRKKYSKEYYTKNSAIILARKRQRRLDSPEKVREIEKKYRETHAAEKSAQVRKWRLANPDRGREAAKRWKDKHPMENKEMQARTAVKRRNAPGGKLRDVIRNGIYYSLRGNGTKAGRRWETLTGYTVVELKQHLEKQFTPAMSWDNYGTYWHVDHKIPIDVFNFDCPEDIDFKRCWELKNLQPLEKTLNLQKGAKLENPFQPSLALKA